jgi:hypothetical protein
VYGPNSTHSRAAAVADQKAARDHVMAVVKNNLVPEVSFVVAASGLVFENLLLAARFGDEDAIAWANKLGKLPAPTTPAQLGMTRMEMLARDKTLTYSGLAARYERSDEQVKTGSKRAWTKAYYAIASHLALCKQKEKRERAIIAAMRRVLPPSRMPVFEESDSDNDNGSDDSSDSSSGDSSGDDEDDVDEHDESSARGRLTGFGAVVNNVANACAARAVCHIRGNFKPRCVEFLTEVWSPCALQ